VHVLAECAVSEQRTGDPAAVHGHETWELFVPLDQPMQFGGPTCGSCRVPAHDILLIAPRTLHFPVQQLNARDAKSAFFVILFLEDCMILLLVRDGKEHRCFLDRGAQKQWAAWLRSEPATCLAHLGFIRETLKPSPDAEHYLDLLVRLFFRSLQILLGQLNDVGPSVSRRESLLYRAQSVLYHHYEDPSLSLHTVAGEVGCSPAHLVRVFREAGGTTFKTLLTRLRLERACWLLQDHSLSIKEIAQLTGWSNQLYFSTVFHQHNGVPPSRMRRARPPAGTGPVQHAPRLKRAAHKQNPNITDHSRGGHP